MKRAELFAVAVALVGCGGPSKGADTTPAPTASTASSASVAPPLTSVPSASATSAMSPDAGGATTADPTSDPGCGGADVDLVAVLGNKKCRPSRDSEKTPDSAMKDVHVTLVPSATKVAPGGHVDLTLEITNGGTTVVLLYFDGDMTLDAKVEDAKGTRLRPPPGEAPKSNDPACKDKDCRRPSSRLVLPPSGKAHARVGWDAVKVAWPKTPPPGCCILHVDPVPGAPLAPGTYKVKVPLPYESTEGNPADPVVSIQVAK